MPTGCCVPICIWTPNDTIDVTNYKITVDDKQEQDDPLIIKPVWKPNSEVSPTSEDKPQYRSVKLNANVMKTQINQETKKASSPKKNYSSADMPLPFTSPPISTSSHLVVNGTSRLPPSQSPTITLLQKAREGHLPKGAMYIDETIHHEKEQVPKGAVLYDTKTTHDGDNVHTDKYYVVPSKKVKTVTRTVIPQEPKKYEGIGPTTIQGIPVSLRTKVKDENVSDWYKQMYNSLHKVNYNNISKQSYSTRGGYMSEPEFDRDGKTNPYLPNSDRVHTSHDIYKHQPKSITSYEPGSSSIVEREVKLTNRSYKKVPRSPMLNSFRDGYESDTTLIRKSDQLRPLSPQEQHIWYKEIQKGGEIPLSGLRKTMPEKPKEVWGGQPYYLSSNISSKFSKSFCCSVNKSHTWKPKSTSGYGKLKERKSHFKKPAPPTRHSSKWNRTLKHWTKFSKPSPNTWRKVHFNDSFRSVKNKISSSLSKSEASLHNSFKKTNSKKTSKTENMNSSNSIPIFCLDYCDPKYSMKKQKSHQSNNSDLETSFSSTETGYGSLSGSQSSCHNQSSSLISLMDQPPLDTSTPAQSPRYDMRKIPMLFALPKYSNSSTLPRQYRVPLSWSRNCIQDKIRVRSYVEKAEKSDFSDWKVFMQLGRKRGLKSTKDSDDKSHNSETPEIDSKAYQAYMNQMQSTIKPSDNFSRLRKFYTTADKIGRLERRKSISQMLTQKDESEFRGLHDEMKCGRENGEFFYSVAKPSQWKNERGLKWRHSSVENLRSFYNNLESTGSSIQPTAHYMLRSNSVRNVVSKYNQCDENAHKKPIVGMKQWTPQTLPPHFRLHDNSPVYQSINGMSNLWSKLSMESIYASKEQLKEINASKKYLQLWKENNKIDQWVLHSKHYVKDEILDPKNDKLSGTSIHYNPDLKLPLHIDASLSTSHLDAPSPGSFSQISPRTCYSVGYSESSGLNSRAQSPGRDSQNDFVLLLRPSSRNENQRKNELKAEYETSSDTNSSITSVRTDIFVEDGRSTPRNSIDRISVKGNVNSSRGRNQIIKKILDEHSNDDKSDQPFRSRPIGLPSAKAETFAIQESRRSRSLSPRFPVKQNIHVKSEASKFLLKTDSTSLSAMPDINSNHAASSRKSRPGSKYFLNGYIPECTMSTIDLRSVHQGKPFPDNSLGESKDSTEVSSSKTLESSDQPKANYQKFANIRDYIITAAIPCRSNNHLNKIKTGDVTDKKMKFESLESLNDQDKYLYRSQSLPRRLKTQLSQSSSAIEKQYLERRCYSLPRRIIKSGSVQKLTDKFESSESLILGRTCDMQKSYSKKPNKNHSISAHSPNTQTTQKTVFQDSKENVSPEKKLLRVKVDNHTQSTPNLTCDYSGKAHTAFNPRPIKVNRSGNKFQTLVNKFEANQILQKILRNNNTRPLGKKICFTRKPGSENRNNYKQDNIPKNAYTYAPLLSNTPIPARCIPEMTLQNGNQHTLPVKYEPAIGPIDTSSLIPSYYSDFERNNRSSSPPPKPEPPLPHLLTSNINLSSAESQHKFQEGQVNIHYNTPTRTLERDTENEIQTMKQLAAVNIIMKNYYEEERRKHLLKEWADVEARKHNDYYTPLQNSPIPYNRYDDIYEQSDDYYRLSVSPTPPRLGYYIEDKTLSRALYDFTAQSPRELPFSKGDLIYITRKVDKNWYEGVHHGITGIFPVKYVEILPPETLKPVEKKKRQDGQAKVIYTFSAQSPVELSLLKGEVVTLLRRIDANWLEGKLGMKTGIFPAAYVSVLKEPSDQGRSSMSPNPPRIQQNGIKGVHTVDIHRSSKSPEVNGTDFKSSEVLHIDTHSEPEPYQAMYTYKPQNDDELELLDGDTVYVMEKCDDGWFVGTSMRTGLFGTFPGNYVDKL
ncbi:Sorbin and SH3 domain-containing protein 1 [Nymphon striatum]|nr:Sorbin and SH3 domain-containing protein 1 [Nymphon striatum]